jgi:fructose-1,6-bisphosphatase class II
MLYIGEKVGCGGPKVDIALDPLEGTTICATGAPNALAVIAMADGGNLLHCPDTYMEKIATGPAGRGVVDLDNTPTENLNVLAEAKRCNVEDLTVIILSRPRHEAIIQEVRRTGARIRLIGDGDVSAAIATTKPETGIDLLLGIGGAPEGVLAAAALRCVGGEFQGRLKPRNNEEIERAKKMGVTHISKKFKIEELAAGDVMFAATGVTDGDYLKGVHFFSGGASTQSVVMRSKTRTIRVINATHYFEHKPNY